MANRLVRFLGGREEEEHRVMLLLAMGFFMGIFLATLQVPAETLITVLGEKYLDIAFFVSGGLGVVSATVYVFAQRHMPFAQLALLNAFLIAVATLGLRLSFYYVDHQTAAFLLFVMMGPLIAITILSFWGIFGRIFDVRSSKRIIGGIDTGQLSATCLAFFAIFFLSDYIQTLDILWISVMSSAGVFLVVLRIVSLYKLERRDLNNLATVSKRSMLKRERSQISYVDLFKNRYFLMLSVFLIFSVCASKFNEFSYRTAMSIWHAGNETELNRAYSLIDAIIIVLSFLIQSFLNDYIIGKFGLKISLMVMPILLGFFTIGAIISGYVFGYDVRTEGYFVFYSFNVMGRILTTSLRDALENPAFKMFFFPVNERDRFDLQSRVEGVVNEFAGLAAGAALIGLGTLRFFEFIHFSYLLIIMIVCAVYMATKLFSQYRLELKKSLLRQKKHLQGRSIQKDRSVLSILNRAVKYPNTGPILFVLKIIERTDPMLLRKYILKALESSSQQLRAYAYKKCVEINNIEHLDTIQKRATTENQPQLHELAQQAVAQLSRSKEHTPQKQEFLAMSRHSDPKQRKYAAQLLAKFPDAKYSPLLMELLQDIHPEVRTAAIVSAGQLKMPDYWPSIIANLHLPNYSNAARSALVSCGDAVYQTVDLLFYRTKQYAETMLGVVQMLGRLGGHEGMERIWKKIDYPNKRIFHECLNALSCNAYQTQDLRAARLRLQIEEEVGAIAWNMQALLHIPRTHPVDKFLVAALEEENKQNQEDLFMVMGMVYDPQSVQLVKENVKFGTPESLTYAVELMNIFLEEALKPKVFPLFDDLRPAERIARLSDHYAPEYFKNYEDLLLQIINRDYNRIGRWTKGLAIYRLASLSNAKLSPDLIANMFNPDKLLLQASAYVLFQKDRNEYRRQTLRIEGKTAKELDMALLPPMHLAERETWRRPLLLLERAIFLKQVPVFANVPGDILTELAEIAAERNYKADQLLVAKDEPGEEPLRIILYGRVRKHAAKDTLKYLEKYDIIGLQSLVPSDIYRYNYTAAEACSCIEIPLNKFFSLMGMQVRLLDTIITHAQAQHKKSEKTPKMSTVTA